MAEKKTLAPSGRAAVSAASTVADGYFDVDVAAAYTGTARVTIMRRIGDDTLPSVFFGRKRYVAKGDLDALFGEAPALRSSGVSPSDETLRQWAQHIAEQAPLFAPSSATSCSQRWAPPS